MVKVGFLGGPQMKSDSTVDLHVGGGVLPKQL